MRRHIWKLTAMMVLAILLAAPLLATGCGSESPSPVTEKFIRTMSDRKFAEAYDMLAEGSPARTVSREEFVSLSEANFPAGLTFENIKIIDERIDGNKATVKWSAVTKQPNTPDENTEQELSLVQGDDGNWKVWE